MQRTFYIVGPTATGKSELAADVAFDLGAEIVGGDAFQVYRGLDLLTAKPDATTLAKVPHHLIGSMSISEELNVEKFRIAALRAIADIHSRGKSAIVVGGTGLYIKALTHGLAVMPDVDPKLRARLNMLSADQLRSQLIDLDPEAARKIDMKNRRRVVRALEIHLATGKRVSEQRGQWKAATGRDDRGVFVFRERDELYGRINSRVEAMFENGVIEEVRAAGAVSSTASKMIGLDEIRDLIGEKMSILRCVNAIQQATRHYAKRQLTWFRRQTNFEQLNLSLLTHNEAVEWISQRARRSFAQRDD